MSMETRCTPSRGNTSDGSIGDGFETTLANRLSSAKRRLGFPTGRRCRKKGPRVQDRRRPRAPLKKLNRERRTCRSSGRYARAGGSSPSIVRCGLGEIPHRRFEHRRTLCIRGKVENAAPDCRFVGAFQKIADVAWLRSGVKAPSRNTSKARRLAAEGTPAGRKGARAL